MLKLFLNPSIKKGHINPEIYGHFSEHLGRCIYEGIYVGDDSSIPNENGMRTDVVNALKEIDIPLLRWPGGCFADEYHWLDGVGPKENRRKMINTHWGGVLEDNSFGTHEYFELCRQLGCKTYINGNVGSGTVREMSEWVEYMTFPGISPMADLRRKNGQEEPWTIDYLGIGNENWGCGGNMTPSYYANLYRNYQTYIRQYDPEKPIMKICGGANVEDYFWTEGVLKTCFEPPQNPNYPGFMDGLSLHYYVHPEGWEIKGSATDFDENDWYKTLSKAEFMETLIKRHGAIMDQYDPEKKIGMIVDEWGDWFTVEPGTNPGFLYQQNTMRDALVAGITLNIFNRHCDRVKMACLAQMVNVLQSVILTDKEKMILTPTWFVFHLYKHHQDNDLIDSYSDTQNTIGTTEEWRVNQLSHSASVDQDGHIHLTLCNPSCTDSLKLECILAEYNPTEIKAEIITESMNAYNTFEHPNTVTEKAFDDYTHDQQKLYINLPPCSVTHFYIS